MAGMTMAYVKKLYGLPIGKPGVFALVLLIFQFEYIMAQNLEIKHKIVITSSDTSALLGKSACFYSAYNSRINKGKLHSFIHISSDSILDTLHLKKTKWNGRCVFVPGVADTLTLSHIRNNHMKMVFMVTDSQSKVLMRDTITLPVYDLPPLPYRSLFIKGNPQLELKATATIANESRYSTAGYAGQDIPAFYSRTRVQAGIEAFGLPVSINYFVTSENNYRQDINNFQVSLDVAKLKNNLADMEKKSYSYDKYLNYKQALRAPGVNGVMPRPDTSLNLNGGLPAVDSLSRLSNSMKSIRNPYQGSYADSLNKLHSKTDSLFSGIYKTPLPSLDKSALGKLSPANINTDLLHRNFKLPGKPDFDPARYISGNKPDLTALKREQILKYNRVTDYRKFLSGIERLEIGNFIPAYSPIWANAINLKGIHLGYRLNRTLIHVFGGLQNNPNGQDQSRLFKREVYAAQAVYILNDHFNVYAGYLFGIDAKNALHKGESNNIIYFPVKNHVVNTGFNFNYRAHEVTAEISKSTFMDVGASRMLEGSTNALQNISFAGTAFNAMYKLNINRTHTVITNSLGFVNPYFNSFGLNYLRKNIKRYDVKITQTLFKRLTLGGAFKNTQNSGASLVSNQYSNRTYTLSAGLSLKGILKRINLLGMENQFNADEYKDSAFNNRQRIYSATVVWMFPVSLKLKMTSVWNITGQQLINTETTSHFYSYSFSNTARYGKFIYQADYSYSRPADSLSQELIQVSAGTQWKALNFTAGYKHFLTGGSLTNFGAFGQAAFLYKRTQAGLRYDIIAPAGNKMGAPSSLFISNGNTITLNLVQSF